MRLLLDTHVWLWWFASPEKLAPNVRTRIGDPANEIIVSAASAWEVSIKYALGKLSFPGLPDVLVFRTFGEQQMMPLAISHEHALRIATLPFHHRDPFDRVLIAQAQMEDVPIITADERLLPYDVEIVWAGAGRKPRQGRTRRSVP